MVKEALNFHSNSNPLHAFSHLLVRTRRLLIHWRSVNVNSVETELDKVEMDIFSTEAHDMSNPWDDNSHFHLISLYKKISALQRQNTIKWAQRSRIFWAHNGYCNTFLFHNFVRMQNHFNTITHISDSNGNIFYDRPNFERVFIEYFRNLWIEPAPSNLWMSCRLFPMIYLEFQIMRACFLLVILLN